MNADGRKLPGRDSGALFQEGTAVDRALAAAYAAVAREHKRLGLPLVVWAQGRVVHIPPEEIVIPGESTAGQAGTTG